MPPLNCQISQSLQNALDAHVRQHGDSISHIVSMALSQYFRIPYHTLFQVSTSGALVQGVYERAVSSQFLLKFGDFGLGTFENLDGEMVVLDSVIYQIKSDASVSVVHDDVGTPFALVAPFIADQERLGTNAGSIAELQRVCDGFRDSDNLFYAFRLDGHFPHVHCRAMRSSPHGIGLAKASANQPEFHFDDVTGTLVGIWSPQFSSAFNVAGYHFHFLSDDRTKGGHLLDCAGDNLRIRMERLNDFHLSLPESEEFLRADLSKDVSQDLAYAEQIHRPEEQS